MRPVNAAGPAIAAAGYVVCTSYLAILDRRGDHARCRMGSRACAVAVDDDKTAESVHFVYEILDSRICGLVGAHATIFNE